MARYLMTRLLAAIPVFIVVSIATFSLIRIIPGDLAAVRLGDYATPEDAAALREALGLDRSHVEQYFEWMGGMARGEFGDSLDTGLPVTHQFLRRLPATIELAILSITLSLLIALPLGTLSAINRGKSVDHVIRVVAVLGQAVPNFWLALVILTFLATQFHWVPPFSYRSIVEDPFHNLQQFALPVVILGYGLAATVMRLTRAMMLEVLRHDYVRTAYAKGLTQATVVRRHALRNALIPIVTVIGAQVSALIGGTVIIEQIFSLPGVGKLTLNAIIFRDYTQLQFNVLFFAGVVVATNLLVDVAYVYLDPRVRVSGGAA